MQLGADPRTVRTAVLRGDNLRDPRTLTNARWRQRERRALAHH